MNKIVLNLGLLVFFLSVIFYSQQGLMIEDVLLRSFILFFVVTLLLGIIVLAFIKAINKTAISKGKNLNLNENIVGSKENE
ncbi:MAG: hypothetical protein GXX85_03980 [Ignavibacteria bacterium]|nr:hypothetical protein [Ignavibacteria bacterium]